MTVEEFKKNNPKLTQLEGDVLWDAMGESMLRQQSADQVIKQIKPIWKTHTLRWLYYRKTPNLKMGKNGISAGKMCKECKKGVDSWLGFMYWDKEGKQHYSANCPHCRKELVRVENTTFGHKAYLFCENTCKMFWLILDKMKLVRSNTSGRYDMFGDESRYVKSWTLNMKNGNCNENLKTRKWWEYILIEKPRHNF